MRRLHLVSDLRLRGCTEDFAAMAPVPGGHHCDSCQKTVHNLSALTRRAAERLVAARPGQDTCYRYLARDDGTILFAPDPPRPGAPLLALTLAACTPWGPPPEPAMDDTPAEFAAPDPVIIPPAHDKLDEADENHEPHPIATTPRDPPALPPVATPPRPAQKPAKQTTPDDPFTHEFAGAPID